MIITNKLYYHYFKKYLIKSDIHNKQKKKKIQNNYH